MTYRPYSSFLFSKIQVLDLVKQGGEDRPIKGVRGKWKELAVKKDCGGLTACGFNCILARKRQVMKYEERKSALKPLI